MGLLVVNTALPAALTPLAEPLVVNSGLGLLGILLAEAIAVSLIFFSYQLPPLIFALRAGDLPAGSFIKPLIAVAACSLLLAPVT
jgi:hypothetical protein